MLNRMGGTLVGRGGVLGRADLGASARWISPDLDTSPSSWTGCRPALVDRPEKLNPLSTVTLWAVAVAARLVRSAPRRSGRRRRWKGPCVSAGADVSSFVVQASAPPATVPPQLPADAGRRMADAIEAMEAVTVARHARALCRRRELHAGIRPAIFGSRQSNTRFAIPEVDLGIPLAWGGIPRLVREIGPARHGAGDDVPAVRRGGGTRRSGWSTGSRHPTIRTRGRWFARQLADKATFPIRATKRHVDAVTSSMVGSIGAGLTQTPCSLPSRPGVSGRRPEVPGGVGRRATEAMAARVEGGAAQMSVCSRPLIRPSVLTLSHDSTNRRH